MEEKTLSGKIDDALESLISQSPQYLSEILKDSAGVAGDMVSIVGVVAPHVSHLILTYKQKRAERNILRLFKELMARTSAIEERLASLEKGVRDAIKDILFPALLDYVYNEKEEEKVPYYASGFYKALQPGMPGSITTEFLLYSDLLNQLSGVELLVLSDMALNRGNQIKIDLLPGHSGHLAARGLTDNSFELIQQKLCRLDLLLDSHQEEVYKQVEILDKVVISLVSRQGRNGVSSDVNSLNFSRPHRLSYSVTDTGRNLLDFCDVSSELM